MDFKIIKLLQTTKLFIIMKKITLLMLLFFFSITGYSQLALEGFESTSGPDALPSTNWTLGTGNWAVFDNAVGIGQRWGINSAVAVPPIIYQGTNAAYVNRENIGQGNISEDYLATPLVTIPANGELHFYTRGFTNGNQGTLYQIKVAPATATQTNPAAYSLVQQWDEVTLNTTFNLYEEKVVSLSAYIGQQVYVSFVKIYNQPGTGLDGDRWLVDNVSINSQCITPTGLTFSALTANGASLNWANPSGATSWEIEIVLATGTPTGIGTIYSGTLPYVVTGLLPNTTYKYYVRALCSTGYLSQWSVASANFTTNVLPPICGGNFVDPGGPTANYANNANVTTTICPTNPGDLVTVTFTAFSVQNGFDFLKVYDGNDITAPLLANLTGTAIPPSFTSTAATGCLTFVFTSNATTTAAGWISNVSCAPPPSCRVPAAIATSTVTSNSVILNWTQPVNPDTTVANAWQVLALPCGSPAPNAGTTGFINTSTNPFTLTGLNSATCYDIYIRAVCSLTDSSVWGGPSTITTQVSPPICGGNFVDAAGPTTNYANNSDSTVSICPITPGDVVTVTFTSFNTEATWDGLYVFDGNSITAPQIASANGAGNVPGGLAGSFWGTAIPGPFTSTSATGCLTFRFRSDGSINNPGWISTITCAPPATCRTPTAITASAVTSNSVTLNWTQPINPDTTVANAWQVLALTCGSPVPTAGSTGFINASTNPFTLTGLNSATCYDIYIRAVCSLTDSSTWGGPRTITTQVAPPICGGNFTDAAGPTANYANNSDSTVTICPITAGDVVTVTFTSFNTEATWDGLYVFDGNSITAPQIASANGAGNVPGGLAGSYWGTVIPGPFTSTSATGCLTFRFRSDGSINNPGWVSNVTCAPPPTCIRPITLTATNITPTSALLGWTDTNIIPATQWEILVLPFGATIPLPSATGTIVSTNPTLITGLPPATKYTFYVRAVCSTTDFSAWSTGKDFSTLIINDECSGAIFAPVNSSAVCQQTTSGTIGGATASSVAIAPCIGTADDDAWFQFVATNPFLTITLLNVTGSTTNLNFAVYSGNCGALTSIFCSTAFELSGVANGLTIGQTYYIRVYSNANTPQTSTFNLCISTPASCLTGESACQNLSYPNTTGIDSQGTIGCLGSSPNPTYYTINIQQSGPINLLLTQSTQAPIGGVAGTPNLDVDYAAWGPFTSSAAACAAIGNPPTLTPGIGVPLTQTTGCSFSFLPTENLNIVNAIAGQVYVILITNFSNNPGYISLTQSNATTPGSGVYFCCPNAYFTYSPVSYCKQAGTPNPIAAITSGSLSGIFSSTPGLVFVSTSTGEVDLMASAPGNYLITNTVGATASCDAKTQSYTINISEPTSATIAYGASSYCQSITTPQAVSQSGTPGGSYSATPNIGLNINPATGEINPSLSSPGNYLVTYGLPGSVCTNGNPTVPIEILPLPNIAQPAPISACYTTGLPSLTVGNYYSQTGGVGAITLPITTSQTVYIYAVGSNGCINEKSFTVTINSVPTPILYTVTPSSCDIPAGSITVTNPTGSGSPTPGNLFISEVTDANTGSLTYVEIYNGTGAPINLSNYKIRTFNNGSATATTGCDNILSGVLNSNSTHVISVGSATNLGGVVPNQVFASCSGVNTDDCIKLTTLTDSVIDLWGRSDGTNFTPSNQVGYTYRRLNTAVLPSTTWNPAEWTALDPEDYTNVGTYALSTSNYQYSIDNGVVFQSPPAFNLLAPGNYQLVVKDTATGCLSTPINVIIDPINPLTAVTGFSYTTPVCKNGTNPTPGGFATGFTTGGVYSEDSTTTGLVFINTATGEIDLVNSSPGIHTVNYTVASQPALCLAGTSSSAQIEIIPVITPVIGFTYPSQICKNAQLTLSPLAPNLSPFAVFSSSPTGLVINTNTGVIDLVNSVVGTYDIIVTVTADPNTCRVAAVTSPAFQLEIKPVVTLVTGFNYDAPLCAGTDFELPNLNLGFSTGGMFSSTAGLIINSSTGAIDLTSTPGTYTVTYTANPNVSNCEVSTPGTTQITIVPPVTIELTGGCQSVNYILTATPVNGSFVPETATYSWENSSGVVVGTTQSIVVTAIGVYTVTVTVAGCETISSPFPVDSIFCVIQKGISVNNDGLNDTFDLTGYDVKNLSIFNRLGVKSYSRNNYIDEWGGQSDNGDDLPDGTYYYVIKRNNGETKTGWIYINRAQ